MTEQMTTNQRIDHFTAQIRERLPQLTDEKIADAARQYYRNAQDALRADQFDSHREWSAYADLCYAELDRRYPRKPAHEMPATGRQIDLIVKLLAYRQRSGDGGGFVSTKGLYDTDGNVSRDAVAKLTKSAASQLIDSLKGAY